MTEVEAQKFIARWTPPRHRCEVTRAKIRRIKSYFLVIFCNGITALVISVMHYRGMKTDSVLFLLLRAFLAVLGIGAVGFALWMMRRLDRVRRALYSQPPLQRIPQRAPQPAPQPSPVTNRQSQTVNG
jgi:hypothetical protein